MKPVKEIMIDYANNLIALKKLIIGRIEKGEINETVDNIADLNADIEKLQRIKETIKKEE